MSQRQRSKSKDRKVDFGNAVNVGSTYSSEDYDRKPHEKSFIEKCQDACEGVYECIKSCLPSSGGKMSRKRSKINKRKTKRTR